MPMRGLRATAITTTEAVHPFRAGCGDAVRVLAGAGCAVNDYTCGIDLNDDAKAVAVAVEAWMALLQSQGKTRGWRLYRRKLGFGAPRARDFQLKVAVTDMTQLDHAFRFTGSGHEGVERLCTTVHQMVGEVDVALYRPFPDPERAERMALV